MTYYRWWLSLIIHKFMSLWSCLTLIIWRFASWLNWCVKHMVRKMLMLLVSNGGCEGNITFSLSLYFRNSLSNNWYQKLSSTSKKDLICQTCTIQLFWAIKITIKILLEAKSIFFPQTQTPWASRKFIKNL